MRTAEHNRFISHIPVAGAMINAINVARYNWQTGHIQEKLEKKTLSNHYTFIERAIEHAAFDILYQDYRMDKANFDGKSDRLHNIFLGRDDEVKARLDRYDELKQQLDSGVADRVTSPQEAERQLYLLKKGILNTEYSVRIPGKRQQKRKWITDILEVERTPVEGLARNYAEAFYTVEKEAEIHKIDSLKLERRNLATFKKTINAGLWNGLFLAIESGTKEGVRQIVQQVGLPSNPILQGILLGFLNINPFILPAITLGLRVNALLSKNAFMSAEIALLERNLAILQSVEKRLPDFISAQIGLMLPTQPMRQMHRPS